MNDIYKYLKETANLISESRFGNKMILKGGSALISKMIENNRTEFYRKTTDIDIHCDKKEIWIDFYTNIENILNSNKLGYNYKIIKRRSLEKGLDTSDSLQFELTDRNIGQSFKFKIDMNIKSNSVISCEYSPLLQMNTYDALTMLSDKIVVVSSCKIYRRIKDLYDLCVLASMYNFKYSDVLKHLNVKHPGIKLTNMLVFENFNNIEHAYNMYNGIENKPDIEVLINLATCFLQPLYIGVNEEMIWNSRSSEWMAN